MDLKGDPETGIIGYKAKRHSDVIDVENIDHYEIHDFWDPIRNRGHSNLILDTDDFYILASKEEVSVPPDYAAEMLPLIPMLGSSVYITQAFDPGFGHDAAGGGGRRAVLEVRSHDVPFVLEDGQVVGRLVYERLTAVPTNYTARASDQLSAARTEVVQTFQVSLSNFNRTIKTNIRKVLLYKLISIITL